MPFSGNFSRHPEPVNGARAGEAEMNSTVISERSEGSQVAHQLRILRSFGVSAPQDDGVVH